MRKRGGVRPDEYFATIVEPDRLADAMIDKIRVWRQWCNGRGLLGLWEKKLSNYYGTSLNGNSSQGVSSGGTEGELAFIKVNDLHNLIQNQLVLVTSQRPAGIARSVNASSEALKASRIGTAVAEHYMAQMNFESLYVNATEMALLCDEAYTEVYWDRNIGDEVAIDQETGQRLKAGDARLRTHCAWNVARDPGMPVKGQKWHIVSYLVNKFEMAAQYPQFEHDILQTKEDELPEISMNKIPDDSDCIYAHLLIHDRTAKVEEGRYSLLVGGKIIADMKLDYKSYPLDRISPSDVIDGCLGYTAANDIMALEEVTDAIHSIITTNEVNFGGNIIIGPTGGNINHSNLAKGTRYVEVDPEFVDKIKVMELLRTPQECFNYINMLGMRKEQAVGVNSVIRGQPEGQLSGASGAALALIQSQAISFNSGIQRSYFLLLSSSMTKIIETIARYADTARIARMTGKSRGAGLKEFKYIGQDLQGISSIVFELVNPILQTVGGRLEMAKDLLSNGQIKSPKQYINVAMTGQLDVLTDDDEADGILILEENEWLADGRPFQAVITQNHADHIKGHNSQITLEAQQNDPEYVVRVLSHIQQHVDLWQQASISNPGILMATGQAPLIPQQPGAPMPAPGPSQKGLPPPHDDHAPSGKVIGQVGNPGPNSKKAQEVGLPTLPNVAGTQNKPVIPGVTTPS